MPWILEELLLTPGTCEVLGKRKHGVSILALNRNIASNDCYLRYFFGLINGPFSAFKLWSTRPRKRKNRAACTAKVT